MFILFKSLIMNLKPKLFYVEDDETLSFVTKDHLEMNGYAVYHFADGESALEGFINGNYDLCILDVMLPKMDGFQLAKEIRRRNIDIPILFLTAKALKEDRIEGLRLGADDYISKPFSIEELILKVKVFLRRSRIAQIDNAEEYTIGDFNFNYPNLSLEHKLVTKTLTQREADLLELLIRNKGSVVKRSDILIQIWGEDDYFLGRSLDVFISRLRKYLQQDSRIILSNIHGVGFKLYVKES